MLPIKRLRAETLHRNSQRDVEAFVASGAPQLQRQVPFYIPSAPVQEAREPRGHGLPSLFFAATVILLTLLTSLDRPS